MEGQRTAVERSRAGTSLEARRRASRRLAGALGRVISQTPSGGRGPRVLHLAALDRPAPQRLSSIEYELARGVAVIGISKRLAYSIESALVIPHLRTGAST